MFIYNQHGKRVSLEEVANLRKLNIEHYDLHLSRISSSKSNPYGHHKLINIRLNSPWELELQRFLIQGGRKIATPLLLRKPKRYIQSAGSRLLQEYTLKENEAEEDMDVKSDLFPSRYRMNATDSDDHDKDEFLNIEFHANRYPSKKQSSSIDNDTLRKRSQMKNGSVIGINNGRKSCNLRLSISDIRQKIEDNETMGIHTYSYQDSSGDNETEILKKTKATEKGKEDDDTHFTPLSPPIALSSSSSSSSSSLSSSDNLDDTDEVDLSNKFKRNLAKKIQ
ncbi:unnamed protein product, partial [Heterobilharzia americana]